MESEKAESYKLNYFHPNSGTVIIIGSFALVLLSIIHAEEIGPPFIFPLIVGVFLFIVSLILFSRLPKHIKLSEELLMIGNNPIRWETIEKVTFSLKGRKLRHIAEIKGSRTKEINLAIYIGRLQLRKSLETFARLNGVKVVIEDRGVENFWF